MENQNLVENAQRWLGEDEVIKEASSDSKTKLFVKHMMKEVVEDDYEQGEIGNRKFVMDSTINKYFDSFDDFKKYVDKFWGLSLTSNDDDAWGVIDNRIIFQRQEDDDGNEVATKDPKWANFKEGKISLWSATYDFVVELIIQAKTDEESIREFTGVKN